MATMCVGFTSATIAQAQELPDPDGKPADMTKPVKVFIIMGQSNTLEMGKVTDELKTLYPFLVDNAGAWTIRQDVRNVSVMVGKGVYRNDWLTVNPAKIGIEIGIGHQLGNAMEEPVMILKSSIGNRGLGWDLLPPGSERVEFTDKDGKTYVYPGYKDEVRHGRWEKGNVPPAPAHTWYAGKQYDDDVANAKKVLSELAAHYPEATKFEVAGFLWWQGEKDAGDAGHSTNYEKNLVQLIAQLRKDFESPNAKFVMATIGEVTKESTGNGRLILDGMLAADGESGKHPDFKGNVSTVYSHPYANGGSGNGHYSGNAKTYMDVGLKMGEAMAKLIKK